MSLWKCNSCGGQYNDRLADGGVYMHACSPGPADKNGVQAELPNKRDESIAFDRQRRARDIVAAGAGVTAMQGQAPLEPPWILAMRSDYVKSTI